MIPLVAADFSTENVLPLTFPIPACNSVALLPATIPACPNP